MGGYYDIQVDQQERMGALESQVQHLNEALLSTQFTVAQNQNGLIKLGRLVMKLYRAIRLFRTGRN